MMMALNKLLFFVLKQEKYNILFSGKHILRFAFMLMVTLSFSQEQEKTLERSNDYIYDANKIVNEDFVTAEMEYRKAVSIKPDNAIGNYNLGNAYYKSGLLDEALVRHIEAAQQANTKEERHNAFHNIGNTLMQQNQCKKAVEAYKNALRNNPSDDETRYNLALAKECADKQGESDDGEKDKKEDQKEEENKDQDNKDDKNKDKNDQDQDQENNDEGDKDEDKKDGDDKEDDKGNPKDQDKDKKGNSNDKKKQQPQQGKLSPQQVKNLLEAMNNEEKKVQDKINAKKAKGVKIKTEKDW